MAKKLRIAGWLCGLLAFIVFHKHFLVLASRMVIYFYSSHQLGAPLKYSAIKLENGSLAIYQPYSKNFHANKLEIKLAINWKTRQLDLSLALDQPIWHIELSKIEQASWKSWLQRDEPWMKVHVMAKVLDGVARWSLPNQEEGVLYFNLEASNLSGGCINGQLGQSLLNQGQFRLQAFHTPEAMCMDWHCQGLDCASAFAFLNALFPKLPLGLVSSGNLEGDLTAIFPVSQRPYLKGELFLDHLQLAHQSGLKGTIKKARIKIEPDVQVLSGGVKDQATIGSLEILEPSSLMYVFNAKEVWLLKDVRGNVRIDSSKAVFIDLRAVGVYQDRQSQFNIKGEANLNPRKSPHLSLDFACSSANQPDGHIQFLVHPHTHLNTLAEIRFIHLPYAEWGFLQTFLSVYWPPIAEIEFQDGILNAFASAEMTQKGVTQLKCHYFQAENLKFIALPWKTVFAFPKWTGHGSIDLSQPNVQQSLNAEIQIEEGKAVWEWASHGYPVSDIQTRLVIQEGAIPHALVRLQLAGLKGILDIEGGSPHPLLTLNLEGGAQELAKFLPAPLQTGLCQGFQDRQIAILAHVKGYPNAFDVEGALHVERDSKAYQSDLIHFGLVLRKCPENEAESIHPSGWFYAKHIPLETFISPFIFCQSSFSLSGMGDFKGFFDSNKLEMRYGIETFKLENEHVAFECQSLSSPGSDHLTGWHAFNLKTHSHHGTLPIQCGCYIEKNTGLCFEDIQSQVIFKDRTIDFLSLEAVCKGMSLNGQLNLDYSSPDPNTFSLVLQLPSVNGKVSYLRQFLSTLNVLNAFAKLPLEGDIESTGKGISLNVDFVPNDYTMQMAFQAYVSNGTLPLREKYLALQEVHMDISYDHHAQQLELVNLQGTLLAGKPSQEREYQIVGKEVIFKGLTHPEVRLDVEMNHLDYQLARLVAQTRTNSNSFIEVSLDQELSHFCHVHPKQFDLNLQGWMHPYLFQFKAEFHLDAIGEKIQLLSYPLVALVNPPLLDCMNHFKTGKGYFNVFIDYYHSENQWDYNLQGEEVAFNEHVFHSFALKGKKVNSKWTIDRLQLDDFSLYADFHHEPEKWKIDFLGINYCEGLLMGLTGDWQEESSFIETKIQLLEMDLARLADYSPLQTVIMHWYPNGLIKGKGDLRIECLNQAPWIYADAQIQWANNSPDRLSAYPSELTDIHLNISSEELKFSAAARERRQVFYMDGQASWPSLKEGTFILKDSAEQSNPLHVTWKDSLRGGWSIQTMEGEFCGMNFSLKQAEETTLESWTVLKGQVDVDFNLICPLLKEDIAKKIQELKLGSSYSLQGTYWLDDQPGHSLLDNMYFKGKLSSKEAIVKGYQFGRMEASLKYRPKYLEITHFVADGPAVQIYCPEMAVSYNAEALEWWLFVPALTVKNLRPHLFRPVKGEQEPTLFSHLLLKHIQFQNFSGALNQMRTWQALGSLHFLNPSRKNIPQSSPFFFIPAEIILRLGLDPTVLNPVTGTIYFNMQGDRFYLTKFKDVYSEGRGSKFYLADSSQPAWMDMKGNLSIQVKMKQYNLIFKLADLFTLSIQGNIKKPKYGLQKDEKVPRKKRESDLS